MCSLKDAPWKADFTGPPCRCGVPTPGNEQERRIDEEERQKRLPEIKAKMKVEFEAHKRKRLDEIAARLNLNTPIDL